MSVELGIIEGYYGQPWSWAMRQDQVRFLAGHGYGFYIYAPKADLLLRERWREDYPQETADQLRRTAGVCALGVSRANERAIRFYLAYGLDQLDLPIPSGPPALYFTRAFRPSASHG